MDKEKKIIELKSLVESAEISLQQARKILIELSGTEEEKMLMEQARQKGSMSYKEDSQIIEGIFDGQNMVGPDGKKYSVPANYASKSKLVEGDKLKLTITEDGSFLYKQINLLERDRIIGDLIMDDGIGEFRVLANNKAYKVLNASITYFKGEPGNKVTLLVPAGKESSWAAVENIFKAGEEEPVVEGKVLDKIKEDNIATETTEAVASDDTEIKKEDKVVAASELIDKEENKIAETDEFTDKADKKTGVNELTENEDAGDEFLSHDTDDNKTQVEELSDKTVQETTATPDIKYNDSQEVTDIFEAASQINTDDVKQVDIPKEEQSVAVSATNPLNNNLNKGVDNQGLDEI